MKENEIVDKNAPIDKLIKVFKKNTILPKRPLSVNKVDSHSHKETTPTI